MKKYNEDYLMISGIQHFIFCKRQWSLIHIEQIWKDNIRTYNGENFHSKVDDPFIVEKRGKIIVSRSIPLISHKLGLKGISDCVEFHLRDDEKGAKINKYKGTYDIVPIEYKVGNIKDNKSDISQLCVQAVCLEEMFNINVKKGYIFYGRLRRRVEVEFNRELRKIVLDIIYEMRDYYNSGFTCKAIYKQHCRSCSLYDLCLPKINKKYKKVNSYIKKYVEDI